MADNLSDGLPRDQGSKSHASLYVGLVLTLIAIGIVLYWSGVV